MNKPLCQPLEIPDNLNLKTWLESQAKEHQLNYLLAHAEDGVIWGRFQDGNLITPTEPVKLFPKCNFPLLRNETLQQCRIFGKNSEVMLWQKHEGFKARLIKDDNIKKEEYITENQILWGTKSESELGEFTLVADGQQGLKHAVPLTGIPFKDNERPLRLTVHHYIDDDDSGVARIYLSRLVKLYF
ncbi:type III-D CRISPR-associated protein Csx19 [Nostoc sp.]|uniref:type III-D CRISPR-associated protein Csx19 n=1 Tax=Nostoc sp. TaxID=1180 RepID=UPI002FF10BF1